MKIVNDIKESINKFSLAQLTSNDSGKTSASGTCGVLICTIGSLCFLYGAILKQSDLINQSVIMTTIGAGLLGYRKSKESKIQTTDDTTTNDTTEDSSETPTK